MDIPQFFEQLIADGAFTSVQLEHGVFARNSVGDTPLHCAVLMQATPIVHSLIAAGASLEAAGEFGFTPLHCAAFRRNPDMVRVLLAAGANPSALSEWGETPAALAVTRQSSEVVEVLRGNV